MIKQNLPRCLNFTHHAFIRVKERITLDTNEISLIIKREKFVPIGMEKGSNREHRLFYSQRDSQCFVLIQDIKTQTVVTILPLDYHESISWAVSVEYQKEAKELILGKYGKVISSDFSVTQTEEVESHKYFIVSCDVLDGYCNFVEKFSLGKFEANNYNYDINNLIKSVLFISDILDKITVIINDTNYHVDELMIKRKGKDVAPAFIPIEELIHFEV